MQIKRLAYVLLLMAFLFPLDANSADDDFERSIPRALNFAAYDLRNPGRITPSFRFAVILPGGHSVGWDQSAGKWSGTTKESVIEQGTFDYPEWGNECNSSEPQVRRLFEIAVPSGKNISGEYTVLNSLNCFDTSKKESNFIGTGTALAMGAEDGKHELKLYPETSVIVYLCPDFYVLDTEESPNMFCLDDDYNRNLILSPGVEQTVELTYVYASAKETVVNKVVTPETLSGAWEACRDMGLTKSSGLYTSVYKKLKNAKELHTKGKKKAAMNVNRAAAKEIEAQRGKGIAPLCADIMLKDLRAELR